MTRKQHLMSVGVGVGILLVAVVVALCLPTRDWFAPDPAARVTPEDENISEDEPESAGIRIDHDAHRVVRTDAAGNTLWATPLEGYLGLVRPPHVQADEARAYVTHADGVTALDVRTGAVLWHSPGPADRLLLSGALLLATECVVEELVAKTGRWMTARDVVSGKEMFRVELPANFDPLAIADVAGLILVQDWDAPGGKGFALLIDRTGRVFHRLDRQVVAAHAVGGDRLILTSRDMVRLSDTGDVKWSLPFLYPQWIAGGGLLSLPDGDVVAFLYGRISDSGVQLVRLDPETGDQRWTADCKRLGVGHSEYRHKAIVKLDGDRLRVTSWGSSGTVVEVIDARDGRSRGRDQQKRP